MRLDADEIATLADAVAERLRPVIERAVARRDDATEYVTRAEAARRLSCSLPTVDRLIKDGTLKARKPKRHGRVLVLTASLEIPDGDALAARAVHGLSTGNQ